MGSRWKAKGAKAKALADPMSQIVSQLQSCLIKSSSRVLLTTSGSLLEADAELTELLNRACFGQPVITAEKEKQRFQLSTEETFYLFHVLKCITVSEKSCEEVWKHMNSNRENFPNLFKAYSHLRMKNWVVRSGRQYGVDFVAYRHHPSLVHSEYAVLVLADGHGESNGRLLVWSDYHCTLRLCRGVAKTLLVIYVNKCGNRGLESPSCLDSYTVEERTITQWSPEQSRENKPTSS